MEAVDLGGRTVGVTADRRREDQAVMWRRLGAEVILGPALGTVEDADLEALRAHTEAFIEDPPDFLVANTGLGMRLWFERAAEWGQGDALIAALGGVRVAARGPKGSAAVRRAGVELWWRSPDEQLSSVVEHLVAEGIDGRRVAVQLHGEDHAPAVGELQAAGATVMEVPVYRWTLPPDRLPARRLIEACCAGEVDAVTFTAGPAVRNLMALADEFGYAGRLLELANGPMVVGCVGPVCAAVADEEGFTDLVVPEHWRLGALVTAVATALKR